MLEEILQKTYDKSIKESSNEEIYLGLLKMTKEMAGERRGEDNHKKLYYISAEFLVGKLL